MATPAPPAQETDVVPLTPAYDFFDGEPEDEAPASGDSAPANPIVPPPALTPSHSPRLVKLAKEFGVPANEIASMGEDDLWSRVEGIQSYLRGQFDARQQQNQVVQAVEARAQQRVETLPQDPKVDPDLGIDPSEFDERIVGLFKSQAKQIKQLTEELGSYRQRDQLREAATFEEAADQAFSDLAPSYGKFLGAKSAADMDRGSREFQARVAILNLAGGLQALGRMPPKAITAAIRKAAVTMYGADAPQVDAGAYGGQGQSPGAAEASDAGAPQPQLRQQVPPRDASGRFTAQQWGEAGLIRPSNRGGGAEPQGFNKALRSVSQVLRDHDGAERAASNGTGEKDGFLP